MKRLALIVAFLTASAFGQSRQPPSDVDLLAVYCLGYLESRATEVEKFLRVYPESENLIRKDRADQKRIAGYLLPRLQFLEPSALLIAKNQGEIDYKEQTSRMSSCVDVCQPGARQWMCQQECYQRNHDARADRCRDAAFLPY